jgi:L-alanine-DL-glutamate epimerase-like enolase superfamily enzyme
VDRTLSRSALLMVAAADQVIGEDPMHGDTLYAGLDRAAVGAQPSGRAARAASALDGAAWDIRGKALRQPL